MYIFFSSFIILKYIFIRHSNRLWLLFFNYYLFILFITFFFFFLLFFWGGGGRGDGYDGGCGDWGLFFVFCFNEQT